MRPRLARFLSELRRRRVFRAALIYAVVAWVIVQVASTVAPLLSLPSWTPALVLVLAILGFPLAIAVAWVYDVTPGGVVVTDTTPPAAGAVAPPPPSQAAARNSAPSIAVLPFVDMSAAGDQQHFGDGIAEEILNVLARLPHLRVAARTSAFAFRGRNEDVRRIGEQLDVATVLEGSVRAAGNRIRITAQLIDVSNGYHLWSDRFDRELGDIFAIQDEIAHNIVRALDLQIGARSQLRPQAITSNMEAYEEYLRGRQHLLRMTRHDVERSRVLFREAISNDPEFAAAYASAAEASSLMYLYWEASPENLADARAHAERALALAPDQPQAHLAHAIVLSLLQQFDDAAHEFDRALELDPLSADANYYYGRSRWAAGDLTGAQKYFERAAALRPEDGNPTVLLTTIYEALGDEEKARAAHAENLSRAERSLLLNPDQPRLLYQAAGSAATLGRREDALKMADRALRLDPNDAGTWYNVGCLLARIGESDQALEKLEKAVELGFAHRNWVANDNDWATLYDDPRFQALLQRMPD